MNGTANKVCGGGVGNNYNINKEKKTEQSWRYYLRVSGAVDKTKFTIAAQKREHTKQGLYTPWVTIFTLILANQDDETHVERTLPPNPMF